MRKKKIVARKPGKKRKKKLIPIISNIRHPDTGELVHPSFFPENPAMPSEQEKFNKNFDKRMNAGNVTASNVYRIIDPRTLLCSLFQARSLDICVPSH